MQKIAIHSVPRSGSTWLGSIFDSHPNVLFKFQPLFSYKFKNYLTAQSDRGEIAQFFIQLSQTSDDFTDQKDAKLKRIIPTFEKCSIETIVYKEVRYHHFLKNLLQKNETIKVIGLVRNPLSVISSWLTAPKEFRKEQGWKIEEEWRYSPKKNCGKPEEFNGYEKWKEVIFLFEDLKEKHPDRFYLLNYNDLLKDTSQCIQKVFSFCNLNITKQTIDFIQQSSSVNQEDAYSVFKVKEKDDKWVQDLPQFIIEEIKNDPDFIELNKRYNWIIDRELQGP